MNITGYVWRSLTPGERMVCLEFAAEENKKRWAKKKATAATEAQ